MPQSCGRIVLGLCMYERVYEEVQKDFRGMVMTDDQTDTKD